MRVCRGEHEDDVRWWLLQCFQQRIERAGREHVDFINDVDLVAPLRRPAGNFFAQVTNIVHAGIGGAVNLDHQVELRATLDRRAVLTLIARLRLHPLLAVDRLCQQARRGRSCRCRADR